LALGRGVVAPGAAFRGRAAGAAGGGGAGAVRGAGAGEAHGPGGALTVGRESEVVPVSDRAGVVVARRTLELARRGRPTHERLQLYRDITLRGGPELVLFSLGDADFRERRVHGFVPAGRGWRRKEVVLPAVIHKRVLFPLPVERALKRLAKKRHVLFGSPPLISDKACMERTLLLWPAGADHLPLGQGADG